MTQSRSKVDDDLLGEVRKTLAANRSLHRYFADAGELRIERQLPFLFVYRTPTDRKDPGTAALLRGESSYLIAPSNEANLQALVGGICEAIDAIFGAVLVLEIWTTSAGPADLTSGPGFRVVCEPGFEVCSTIHRLVSALNRVRISHQKAKVAVDVSRSAWPPHLQAVVPADNARGEHLHIVGIEISPVHHDADRINELPLARRSLQRQLTRALREAAFEFARRETRMRPRHFHALGRRALTKIVWDADAALSAVSRQFDLLLMVTPVNTREAFDKFKASGYKENPKFFYRRRQIDPPLLKRAIYEIPIEHIDDPTLAFLFEEKRRELGLKLTLVEERETKRFLPTGLALYGLIDTKLLTTALRILKEIPFDATPNAATDPVDAQTFAGRAEEMLGRFRSRNPKVNSRVEIHEELTSLTVSNGNLLVGSQMTFPADRVEALIHHEIGTHVVTHWNGSAQRLQLLEVGLAGYDALQEGLGVFAEYLVGGLTRSRLRTLAIRVVAAHMRVEGANFVETFTELKDAHGFSPHPAFLHTNRVFRGGGLIKDAVYLRGLQSVLDYVIQDGSLEFLFAGKVATTHVPILRELESRKILRPPVLRPPCLDHPEAPARLERVRRGLSLRELVDP